MRFQSRVRRHRVRSSVKFSRREASVESEETDGAMGGGTSANCFLTLFVGPCVYRHQVGAVRSLGGDDTSS